MGRGRATGRGGQQVRVGSALFGKRIYDRPDPSEACHGTIAFTLFKVIPVLRHLIYDMGKAQNVFCARLCKSVKRRRFHFDGQNPTGSNCSNRCFSFPIRGIGGPFCPVITGNESPQNTPFNAKINCCEASAKLDAGR